MGPPGRVMRRSSERSRPVSGRSRAKTDQFNVPGSTLKEDATPGAPLNVEPGTLNSVRSARSDLRLGTHAVEEALRAGRASRVLIQGDLRSRPRLLAIQRLAAERAVPVSFVTGAALAALAGDQRHQG